MDRARTQSGRIGGDARAPVLRRSTAGGPSRARRTEAFVPPEVTAVHGIDRTRLRGQIHRVLLLIPRPQR